ncbi:MAG: GvpL/GvpF family gas vesicle protein [Bacteroidota bacterium]
MPLYLHGLTPVGGPALYRVPDADGPVYTIEHQGMAAVVRPTAQRTYQHLERREALLHLVLHQRVAEAIQAETPLLPVQFGTVLDNEEQVRMLLSLGADRFAEALRQLDGLVQMEITVLWDLEHVFAEIRHEPAVAALQHNLTTWPADEQEAGRVQLGQIVKERLEYRRARLKAPIDQALQAVATASEALPILDDRMVTGLTLLLNDHQEDELDDALTTLDAAHGDLLTFKCVGPMAPHRFAQVRVEMVDGAILNQARALLRLPAGPTTLADVKRAYRLRAGELHPDHNPSTDEATMQALHDAFTLITTFVEGRLGAPAPGEAPHCSLDLAAQPHLLYHLDLSVRRSALAA